MNWKISIVIMTLLIGCDFPKNEEDSTLDRSYLIEASTLKLMLNDPQVKLLDFRKKEAYEKGHLAEAMNIWRTDIEDSSFPFKGMMATKEQIELLFSNMGIKTDDTIIIYDDNGLCNASRLWWILQNYEFKNVKMLHGGLEAWSAIGGTLTKKFPKPIKSNFKLVENPEMKFSISKDEVHQAVLDGAILLDTRTADEFTGKRQKKGASKGGRIPNSIRIDWADAIDYHGDGRIKSDEELKRLYSSHNLTVDQPLIVYCHSGVRSAHTSFVLTQILGYQNVKNYDGSWTEWSYFDNLPFEMDTNTVIFK